MALLRRESSTVVWGPGEGCTAPVASDAARAWEALEAGLPQPDRYFCAQNHIPAPPVLNSVPVTDGIVSNFCVMTLRALPALDAACLSSPAP